MDAAAPKGAPRRPQLPDFLETVLAPPGPARGPEAGSAHMNCKHFTDFHGSGVTFVHARFYGSKKSGFYIAVFLILEEMVDAQCHVDPAQLAGQFEDKEQEECERN